MASTQTAQSKYFKGMRDAKITNRLPYFEANQLYDLKLLKTFVLETRDKGDAFIAEFEIVKTTGTQKVGSKIAFYQGLAKKDVAFGAIKTLLYAVLGKDPNNDADAADIAKIDEDIEDEMQKAITENHMAGAQLKCQTVERIGKESGKPYTAHNWLPA